MIVAVGTDHAGLRAQGRRASRRSATAGTSSLDCGAFEVDPDDDYPDFAARVARAVIDGTRRARHPALRQRRRRVGRGEQVRRHSRGALPRHVLRATGRGGRRDERARARRARHRPVARGRAHWRVSPRGVFGGGEAQAEARESSGVRKKVLSGGFGVKNACVIQRSDSDEGSLSLRGSSTALARQRSFASLRMTIGVIQRSDSDEGSLSLEAVFTPWRDSDPSSLRSSG